MFEKYVVVVGVVVWLNLCEAVYCFVLIDGLGEYAVFDNVGERDVLVAAIAAVRLAQHLLVPPADARVVAHALDDHLTRDVHPCAIFDRVGGVQS